MVSLLPDPWLASCLAIICSVLGPGHHLDNQEREQWKSTHFSLRQTDRQSKAKSKVEEDPFHHRQLYPVP